MTVRQNDGLFKDIAKRLKSFLILFDMDNPHRWRARTKITLLFQSTFELCHRHCPIHVVRDLSTAKRSSKPRSCLRMFFELQTSNPSCFNEQSTTLSDRTPQTQHQTLHDLFIQLTANVGCRERFWWSQQSKLAGPFKTASLALTRSGPKAANPNSYPRSATSFRLPIRWCWSL